MKFAPSTATLAALAVALPHAASQTVSGEAEGFASGVTGGGDATPDYPQTIEELASLLTDDVARVIVLDREFDFTESEGQESGNVCASWGTDSSCQKIIQDDCGDSPALTGTWWVAPRSPIDVGSNKSILGVGAAGAIKGKGLRFRDGASNVIVQNIAVTDLNPEYVWGGDAISFDGSDQIWIDHVTVRYPLSPLFPLATRNSALFYGVLRSMLLFPEGTDTPRTCRRLGLVDSTTCLGSTPARA